MPLVFLPYFLPLVPLVLSVALAVSCSPSPVDPFAGEENEAGIYRFQTIDPYNLETFDKYSSDVTMGMVISSSVDTASVSTAFTVRVEAVLKGPMQVGDMIEVNVGGGDITRYDQTMAQPWNTRPPMEEAELEKTRETVIHSPYVFTMNCLPGGRNLYMLREAPEEPSGTWTGFVLAERVEGIYHFRCGEIVFDATLEEVKAAVHD